MYLSAYLKKHGFKCEILDFAFYNKTSWKALIEQHPADLYGLTVYSASFPESAEITKLIKEVHPKSKIVWGGPHPTFEYTCWQQVPELNFIIMVEGEETLLELCQNFNNPLKYQSIMGLAHETQYPTPYGFQRGFFYSNMRPLIKNIDDIPIPDRNAVPIHEYTRKVEGIKSCGIMTSRGCPYNCRFCCSRKFWKYPRFHSVKRVIEELKVIKNLGFNSFHAWDDTFTLNHKRLFKILEEVKKMNFVFRCNGDLRLDTKKVLQKLYEAGCKEYSIGIESGDQKVLDNINKRTTVKRNRQVLKWAKEVGLPVKAYVMVGNPGETWESVHKTLEFIKETGPEYYTISTFVPLPGCEFYHNAKKYGIKFRTKDWKEFFAIGRQNEGGAVHDTEFMTAEEIADARQFLIDNLPKQTGKLQDYYSKVKNK